MYTLINSIIQNEKHVDRLYFHILVLENIPLFLKDFTNYFGEYMNEISFEFKSIRYHIPECIEYSDIASTTLPAKQRRNWLNNVMNFARFCMPNAFDDVDVGIYLDVDMIVQSSLSLLYDEYFNAHDYKAWSVMNRHMSIKKKQRSTFLNDYFNHNISAIYPSISNEPFDLQNIELFNAGMLMFDLNVWRMHNLTEQSLELFKLNQIFSDKFGKKPWNGVTQPIMNMLFVINQIEVGKLDYEWNLVVKDIINCQREIKKKAKRSLESANILHWAGGCKPYTDGNINTAYLWKKYIPRKANLFQWGRELNVTWM